MTEHLIDERIVADPDEMAALGAWLAPQLRAGDLLVLTGPLGAGKTTFTRALGAALQVRGPVTSPTFVLARTHPSTVGGPDLVHVDAYRLESAAQLDDLDLDYAGSIVVVEWGDGLLDGVTDSWLEILIERPLGASGRLPSVEEGAVSEVEVSVEEPIEARRVCIYGHGPRWTA